MARTKDEVGEVGGERGECEGLLALGSGARPPLRQRLSHQLLHPLLHAPAHSHHPHQHPSKGAAVCSFVRGSHCHICFLECTAVLMPAISPLLSDSHVMSVHHSPHSAVIRDVQLGGFDRRVPTHAQQQTPCVTLFHCYSGALVSAS